MKKLLLLVIATTLISCQSNEDDDVSGRTTDPIIGSWYGVDNGENVTININSDGTVEGGDTWRNYSSNPNFNSTTQVYIINEGTEDETIDTFTFASDFSTMTCPDCILWTRQ